MKRIGILAVGVTLIACGDDGGTGSRGPALPALGSPRVSVVAPQRVAVGDTIEVVGANFISPQHGRSLLQFRGAFMDDQGGEHPFERLVEATYHEPTRLSWKLWPDVVFHPEGNRLGYFLGEITVINNGLDGSRRASSSFRVKVDVQPSLLIRALHPAGSNCPMVVPATNEETPLALAVEALGFAPGAEGAPLEFTWSFGLEHLDVKPDNFGTWDLDTASQTKGTATVVDNVVAGTVSGLQDGSACGSTINLEVGRSTVGAFFDGLCRENTKGEKQFLFQFLDDVRAVPGVKVLRTRRIAAEDQRGQVQAPITVAVRDAQGRTGNLALPVDIFKPVSMIRDSLRDRIVSRDQIVRLQDEVAPGNLPAQVTLRESHSEQKTIDNGHNLSPSGWTQLGYIRGMNLNLAFGVDQRQGRSSSDDRGIDVTQEVPPGFCMSYYRQAERVRKYAKLVGHTQCGQAEDYGELYIDDWQWSREIATSSVGCPAASSQLKPAGECFEGCEVVKISPGGAGSPLGLGGQTPGAGGLQ